MKCQWIVPFTRDRRGSSTREREGKKKNEDRTVPSCVPPSPLRVAPTFNWVRLETCRGFGLVPSFLPSFPPPPSSCIRPSMYRLMSARVDWSCTQSWGSRGYRFVEISKAWEENYHLTAVVFAFKTSLIFWNWNFSFWDIHIYAYS